MLDVNDVFSTSAGRNEISTLQDLLYKMKNEDYVLSITYREETDAVQIVPIEKELTLTFTNINEVSSLFNSEVVNDNDPRWPIAPDGNYIFGNK